MIVGVVLDGQGRPICCELWPGNTADVTTLIPVVDRLRKPVRCRQGLHRGRPRHDQQGDDRGVGEARAEAGCTSWGPGCGRRTRSRRRSWPERAAIGLSVPSVKRATPRHRWRSRRSGSRAAATSSAATRTRPARMPPIGKRSWRRSGRSSQAGEKSLVGNKGYRRYLCSTGPDHFQIDEAKIEEEARYDGKWVLRTNMDLDAADVALQYKGLWMVEACIRSCKSLLHTRPIYHKCDETIRGHVFCSFLAMVLRQELEARLARRWSRVRVGRRDRRPGPLADGGSRSRTASGSCCAARSRAPAARSSKQREWPCRPPCNESTPASRRPGGRS